MGSRSPQKNCCLKAELPNELCCRTRRRILHVFIEPAQHLVDQLLVRLHCRVPVRLVRKHHQTSGATVASNGFVELVRLQGRRTGIRVFRAMHDEERRLQFVGEENGETFR